MGIIARVLRVLINYTRQAFVKIHSRFEQTKEEFSFIKEWMKRIESAGDLAMPGSLWIKSLPSKYHDHLVIA